MRGDYPAGGTQGRRTDALEKILEEKGLLDGGR